MFEPSWKEPCAGDALRCLKMHISRFANGEAFLISRGLESRFLVKCPRTPKFHTTDFRPMFHRYLQLNKFRHVHAVPYICSSTY